MQQPDDERPEGADGVADALHEAAQRHGALVRAGAQVDEHEREREEQRPEPASATQNQVSVGRGEQQAQVADDEGGHPDGRRARDRRSRAASTGITSAAGSPIAA